MCAQGTPVLSTLLVWPVWLSQATTGRNGWRGDIAAQRAEKSHARRWGLDSAQNSCPVQLHRSRIRILCERRGERLAWGRRSPKEHIQLRTAADLGRGNDRLDPLLEVPLALFQFGRTLPRAELGLGLKTGFCSASCVPQGVSHVSRNG